MGTGKIYLARKNHIVFILPVKLLLTAASTDQCNAKMLNTKTALPI